MSNPYESPEAMTTNANNGDWVAESHLDSAATAQAVSQFFLSEGYRLESGDTNDGVYGIGNSLLRILFGAFVKRYKFKVQIRSSGPSSFVTVEKGMSGAMGGSIGYAKMKKELTRIRTGIRQAVS